MGLVAITIRILPDGPEVDLDRLAQAVRRALGANLKKLDQQPVAFGLVALVATVVVEDASGGSEALEEKLAALPGVSSAETTGLSLV